MSWTTTATAKELLQVVEFHGKRVDDSASAQMVAEAKAELKARGDVKFVVGQLGGGVTVIGNEVVGFHNYVTYGKKFTAKVRKLIK